MGKREFNKTGVLAKLLFGTAWIRPKRMERVAGMWPRVDKRVDTVSCTEELYTGSQRPPSGKAIIRCSCPKYALSVLALA